MRSFFCHLTTDAHILLILAHKSVMTMWWILFKLNANRWWNRTAAFRLANKGWWNWPLVENTKPTGKWAPARIGHFYYNKIFFFDNTNGRFTYRKNGYSFVSRHFPCSVFPGVHFINIFWAVFSHESVFQDFL
jgi:hypothetical protein